MLSNRMGLFRLFSAGTEVAHLTITFGSEGNHRITIERKPAAPNYLAGPMLDTALFLQYAAKALYVLGSGPAAEELRKHLAMSAIVLSVDKFEPFTSFIDEAGQCIGWLRVNRAGAFSIYTKFRVPLRETTNYILDSVLLMFTHAVENQPTSKDRGRLAAAVKVMGQYHQTVAPAASFKALREAPAAAFERYRDGVV